MKRIVAVIGRPGTGKSTLIANFMNRGLTPWVFRKSSLLQFHESHAVCVLGNYTDPEEIFPGTDRLSMAVAPEALRWMLAPGRKNVLFEGDRLGNASTLRALSLDPGVLLRIIRLDAPDHELQRRYMLRGSAQSRQVLEARATKVSNICANPNLAPLIRARSHRTSYHTADITREIQDFFDGSKL